MDTHIGDAMSNTDAEGLAPRVGAETSLVDTGTDGGATGPTGVVSTPDMKHHGVDEEAGRSRQGADTASSSDGLLLLVDASRLTALRGRYTHTTYPSKEKSSNVTDGPIPVKLAEQATKASLTRVTGSRLGDYSSPPMPLGPAQNASPFPTTVVTPHKLRDPLAKPLAIGEGQPSSSSGPSFITESTLRHPLGQISSPTLQRPAESRDKDISWPLNTTKKLYIHRGQLGSSRDDKGRDFVVSIHNGTLPDLRLGVMPILQELRQHIDDEDLITYLRTNGISVQPIPYDAVLWQEWILLFDAAPEMLNLAQDSMRAAYFRLSSRQVLCAPSLKQDAGGSCDLTTALYGIPWTAYVRTFRAQLLENGGFTLPRTTSRRVADGPPGKHQPKGSILHYLVKQPALSTHMMPQDIVQGRAPLVPQKSPPKALLTFASAPRASATLPLRNKNVTSMAGKPAAKHSPKAKTLSSKHQGTRQLLTSTPHTGQVTKIRTPLGVIAAPNQRLPQRHQVGKFNVGKSGSVPTKRDRSPANADTKPAQQGDSPPSKKLRRPNSGISLMKCRLSQRHVAFVREVHRNFTLPARASVSIAPEHELESHCTPPQVNIALCDLPLSAEEILTYFPVHTKYFMIALRLHNHNFSGEDVIRYVYWSRQLTDKSSLGRTRVQKHFSYAHGFFKNSNTPEPAISANPHDMSDHSAHLRPDWKHDYYIVDLAEGVVHHPSGRGRQALTTAILHAVARGHTKVRLSEVRQYVAENKLFDIPEKYDCWAEDIGALFRMSEVTKTYYRTYVH